MGKYIILIYNFVYFVMCFSSSIDSDLNSGERRENDKHVENRCPFITASRGSELETEGVLDVLQINHWDHQEKKSLLMCVLNQRNGNVIFAQEFPLYHFWGVWLDLKRHLENVAPERIVVFSCEGESIYGLRNVTELLSSSGSVMVDHLTKDAVWIWSFVISGKTLFENLITKGANLNNVVSHFSFLLSDSSIVYHNSTKLKQRWEYCSKYGVMGDFCDESLTSFDLSFSANNSKNNIDKVPVIITAGKRTSYLYQSLKSYLRSPGAKKSNFHVLLGSNSSQSFDLLTLLNISYVYIPPSQYGKQDFFPFYYYKEVFQYAADNFNNSSYAIFLEEDVEVSPGFFSFMNQTIHLLNDDPTIYCITGYSSTGLKNLAYNESVLLRGDTPVGWGYALSMNFIREALKAWPNNISDQRMVYDGWIYLSLKGKRECVFPEVNRVRQFGVGLNTIYWLSEKVYFTTQLAKSRYVSLSDINDMKLPLWKDHLRQKIKISTYIKTNICSKNFILENTKESYVMCYNYTINDSQAALANYAILGRCFKTWIYSFQGQHDYVSIIKISPTTTIYLVAHPKSSYSDLCPRKHLLFDIRNLTPEETDIYEQANSDIQLITMHEKTKYKFSDLFKRLFGIK